MIFKGCATALITPFEENKIDYKSLEKIVSYQIDSNVDALVVLGTTGESATLTETEKLNVVNYVLKINNGRVPIIAGTGSNNTSEAVRFTRLISGFSGIDGVLVVTPYYNKCTEDGLVKHFYNVADASLKPVICYNVPSRTGVNISADIYKKIQQHENISAIKDASGNILQGVDTIRISDKSVVYSGDDSNTYDLMKNGAVGVISVASNLYPKSVTTLSHLMLQGEYEKAHILHEKMLPTFKGLFLEVNPAPIKWAMHYKGFCEDELRLPLTPISQTTKNKLCTLMHNFEELNYD